MSMLLVHIMLHKQWDGFATLLYFATSARSLRVKPHTNLPLTTHRSKKNKQRAARGQEGRITISPVERRNTCSSGYTHICTYIR